MRQGGAQVVGLGVEPRQGGRLPGPGQRALAALGLRDAPPQVRSADVILLAGGTEMRGRVFAHAGQLAEARALRRAGGRHERAIDERAEQVEDVVGRQRRAAAHRLGRGHREAAGENGEAAQQDLLAGPEKVVAPVQRGTQGALVRECAGAAGEQAEALAQPGGDLDCVEHAHARGGKLDRQRQPVELAADVRDDVLGGREGRVGAAGAVGEQRRRVGRCQRRDAPDRFAGHAKSLPAGGQHAQVGAGKQERFGGRPGRGRHVLAVVEQQHRVAGALGEQPGSRGERVGAGLGAGCDGLQERRGDERRVGQRAERDAHRVAVQQRQRQPRLAHAGRAGQRQEPGPVAWGAGAPAMVGTELPRGHGIAGVVHLRGEGLAVPDCRSDDRFARATAAKTGYIPHTMVVVPLKRSGRTTGVLTVLDRRDGRRYGPVDVERATLFAELAMKALTGGA